jgi:hypothetical protein
MALIHEGQVLHSIPTNRHEHDLRTVKNFIQRIKKRRNKKILRNSEKGLVCLPIQFWYKKYTQNSFLYFLAG